MWNGRRLETVGRRNEDEFCRRKNCVNAQRFDQNTWSVDLNTCSALLQPHKLNTRSSIASLLSQLRMTSDRDQQRLSDLIGPYQGTYGIAYRVLQPLGSW